MAISQQYPGVFAAMATPMTAEGGPDPAGIRNVVDYLFASGVTGLSLLGSTGESPLLSIAQRQLVLETALEAAKGRGTVYSGAASTVEADVVKSLKAASNGAAGALVPPPYYYPLGNDGVIGFYQRVAEASPVPIILYNIPRMTKIQITPEAVSTLIEHPNIMGLKDSSGDFGYFCAIARIGKEQGNGGFTLYTGSDALLAAALYAGGQGVIGGTVNVVPEVEAALFKAYQQGDREQAVALQGRIAKATAATGVGTFPAGIKGQYALKGLCGTHMAPPIPALTESELEHLRQRLVEAGVQLNVAVKGA
ncbi:MAG TPA: dihydrodipicolinate synthase family protein [Thermomicrobiaceae bacterium]|nr:dihydrodipicolinate synthase family protein [Thermomicrobiaceae bacterium]